MVHHDGGWHHFILRQLDAARTIQFECHCLARKIPSRTRLKGDFLLVDGSVPRNKFGWKWFPLHSAMPKLLDWQIWCLEQNSGWVAPTDDSWPDFRSANLSVALLFGFLDAWQDRSQKNKQIRCWRLPRPYNQKTPTPSPLLQSFSGAQWISFWDSFSWRTKAVLAENDMQCGHVPMTCPLLLAFQSSLSEIQHANYLVLLATLSYAIDNEGSMSWSISSVYTHTNQIYYTYIYIYNKVCKGIVVRKRKNAKLEAEGWMTKARMKEGKAAGTCCEQRVVLQVDTDS